MGVTSKTDFLLGSYPSIFTAKSVDGETSIHGCLSATGSIIGFDRIIQSSVEQEILPMNLDHRRMGHMIRVRKYQSH